MLDIIKLTNMILDLKKLEIYLEETNWENDDIIYEYNDLQERILGYLKEVL